MSVTYRLSSESVSLGQEIILEAIGMEEMGNYYARNCFLYSPNNNNKSYSRYDFVYYPAAGIHQNKFICTIPTDWNIDSDAYFSIGIYNENTEQFQQETKINFRIIKPSSPTIGDNFSYTLNNENFVNPSSAASGLCIQGVTNIIISSNVNNMSAGAGAEYSEITYILGDYSFTTADPTATFIIERIANTGNLSLYCRVKNNMGQIAEITKNNFLNVKPYFSPQIASFSATRTDENGKLNNNGTQITITCNYSYSTWEINNNEPQNNIVNMSIEYGLDKNNLDQHRYFSILQSGVTGTTQPIHQVNLTSTSKYYIQLTIQDTVSSIKSPVIEISTGDCTLYFKDGGTNVSIGMVGTIDKALQINPEWTIYHGEAVVLDTGRIEEIGKSIFKEKIIKPQVSTNVQATNASSVSDGAPILLRTIKDKNGADASIEENGYRMIGVYLDTSSLGDTYKTVAFFPQLCYTAEKIYIRISCHETEGTSARTIPPATFNQIEIHCIYIKKDNIFIPES